MTTATCPNGHPRTAENLRLNHRGHKFCLPCRRETARAGYRRRWNKRHKGHAIAIDRAGRRYCRTCPRTWSIDDAAIERAIAGDPPERLSVAERQEAVIRLRQLGVSGQKVAERVGCTDRTVWRILRRVEGAAA